MNIKTLIAASTLAMLGTAAFAHETPDITTPSTLSRAEVRAELQRAQRAGEIVGSGQPYHFVDAALAAAKTPGLSRAEVRNELANAGGAVQANEAYGTVAVGEPVLSRADVLAEALNAPSRIGE